MEEEEAEGGQDGEVNGRGMLGSCEATQVEIMIPLHECHSRHGACRRVRMS